VKRAAFVLFALIVATNAVAAPDCDIPRSTLHDVQEIHVPPGRTVALALGSGSFHGLAHIGVIEALEAAKVDVHIVTGTSVGALVGSLWASGMPGSEIERAAVARGWSRIGQFSPSSDGFMSNANLRTQLEPLFADRPIESWPKRFAAVATDMSNGHRRLLMTGSGALAVQASTAMPALFAPVLVNGAKLADGALVEPVPVEAARALGASFVIAVDVAYRPYEEAASGITGYGFQSMHILVNSLAERQLRDADFVLRLDVHHVMGCGPEALVAAGRETMARTLPDLQKALQ
jgi:NTE family protein